MCNFKSAIVMKDSIYCPIDHDSHEDMLDELEIEKDSYPMQLLGDPKIHWHRPAPYVRVELTPSTNVFDHDLNHWRLVIDEDMIPDWFDSEKVESQLKDIMQNIFKKRFIVDGYRKSIPGGRWFLKNANVDYVSNNTFICKMIDSTIDILRDSSHIQGVSGKSFIRSMQDCSTIGCLSNLSKVDYMNHNTMIKLVGNFAVVNNMMHNTSITGVVHHAGVGTMLDNAFIRGVYDDAKIYKMKNRSIARVHERATFENNLETVIQDNAMLIYDNICIRNQYGDYRCH